jgi:hypothetical protein
LTCSPRTTFCIYTWPPEMPLEGEKSGIPSGSLKTMKNRRVSNPCDRHLAPADKEDFDDSNEHCPIFACHSPCSIYFHRSIGRP